MTPAKVPDMASQLQGMFGTPWGFVSAKIKFLTVAPVVTDILKSSRSRNADTQRECLALTTLWTLNTEEKYMCRTAMARGSAAAHIWAAYSQYELGFATHFNMYPEVQLPSPHGSDRWATREV